MSPRAYIFQRSFLKGLFLEGLRCTKGNLCFKSDWASLQWGGNLPFLLCFYFVFEGKFQVQAPPGCVYIWRGDLTGGFLCYDFGGGGGGAYNYLEGLDYFRNLWYVYKLTWLCKPLIASLFYYERYFLINRTLASCFKPQS